MVRKSFFIEIRSGIEIFLTKLQLDGLFFQFVEGASSDFIDSKFSFEIFNGIIIRYETESFVFDLSNFISEYLSELHFLLLQEEQFCFDFLVLDIVSLL